MRSLADQILEFRRQGVQYEAIFHQLLNSGVERWELRQALEEIAIHSYDLGPQPRKKSVGNVLALSVSIALLFLTTFVLTTAYLLPTRPLASYDVNTGDSQVTAQIEETIDAPTPNDEQPETIQSPSATAATQPASSSATPPTVAAEAASEAAQPTKRAHTIAIYGDSMEDTMGEGLELLASELKARYPDITFKLHNYGVGAENVSMGLARFDTEFNYKTRHYAPVAQLQPDILILGSFDYNPFSPYDRNQHWLEYSRLIDRALATGADVYVLAEIAALQTGFGVGPGGVNWPTVLANEHSVHIKEQLANVIGLAAQKNVPLINAFAASELGAGWGNKVYVSTNDGIHPSDEGQQLTAKLIAQQLQLE